MSRIYLDYNSTTPTLPAVLEAMRPYFTTTFANAASAHRAGAAARQALEAARGTVARCLGADPDEVFFTSGATEANNLALFGLPHHRTVTSPVEHPSVSAPLQHLVASGHHLHTLTVDGAGRVSATELMKSLTPESSLVTIQLANHETGTIQDINALARAAGDVAFHTDATQAVGKIPIDFHGLQVTTLSCSGHKFYGPQGVGALLVKQGTRLMPRIFGGHQQQGVRPGTEPVALAVGLATALQFAVDEMTVRRQRVTALRQRLLEALRPAEPYAINGAPDGLPHALNLSFPECASDILLIRLDLACVDCSTGSACSSGSLLPSPVLQAMGCPPDHLRSAMRFSLSHLLTDEDVDEAGRRIVREVTALRTHAT